jgi:hypothetical protein
MKRKTKVTIVGREWTVNVWASKTYLKRIAKDTWAEVEPQRSHIDIDRKALCMDTILHELCHAYAHERSIVALQLKTRTQFEEFFCEILAKHGQEMLDNAAKILTDLKG